MAGANLRRRIEALEKSVAATQRTENARVRGALGHLGQETLQALIRATVAAQEGRELRATEAAVVQAYFSALERGPGMRCGSMRNLPDTSAAIYIALLRDVAVEDLMVLRDAARAELWGVPLAKHELEMQQAHATALARECQMAGFPSLEALQCWQARTQGSGSS